jgi:hypothetical protein
VKLERMCQQERNKAVEFKNDLQQQIESLRAEVDKKQKDYSKVIKKNKI